MAEGTIVVPPDSTGKAVRTQSNPAVAGGSHQQVYTEAGPDGTLVGVHPWGHLRTSGDSTALFYDGFDGSVLDIEDRWTAVGTAPSQGATGVLTLPSTANTSSAIRSKPSMVVHTSMWLQFNAIVRFEGAPGTGMGRFWGLGTPAGAPSPTNLVTDGAGFEIESATGNLVAVVYAAGVRTVIATLTRPADNAYHRYTMMYRSSRTYWYIDGLNEPVASAAYLVNNSQDLPVLLASSTTAAGGIGGSPTMTVLATGVGDTSRNSVQISDSTHPWRKAHVVDPTTIPGAGVTGPRERSWGEALNVNPNALQKATYRATCKPTAAANAANALQVRAALHHLATSTKTIRIRRINVQGSVASVANSVTLAEVHRITAAPGGTVVNAGTPTATQANIPTDPRDPTPEAILTTAATGTSAGLLASGYLGNTPSTAAAGGGGTVVYDWHEVGETKPITLRAGVLEGIIVGIISTVNSTWTLTIEIVYTEE